MNFKIPFHLEIPKRSQNCAKGSEPLTPGMECISVVEEKNDALTRQDFCLACWSQDNLKEAYANAQSYWKSRVPIKKSEPSSLSAAHLADRALDLMRQVLSQDSETAQIEAFVLSLLLNRQKRIQFRKTLKKEDGAVYSLYEVSHTDEVWAIKQIPISQIEIHKVQTILSDKLSQKSII